jgi:hypothetical protein
MMTKAATLLHATILVAAFAASPAFAASEAAMEAQRAIWRCQHETGRAGRSETQSMRAYQRCIDRSEAGARQPHRRGKRSRS